jgi:hypothetical protein
MKQLLLFIMIGAAATLGACSNISTGPATGNNANADLPHGAEPGLSASGGAGGGGGAFGKAKSTP